jgi:cation diffusion facilitator family transporter
MLVKLGTWFITKSNAVLSDALESIVNIGAGVFSLYSLYLSSLPKDDNHPYGHGKIEFITVALEGSFIGVAGLLIIFKSGYNLIFPEEISAIDWAIYLTAFTGLANFILGYFSEKSGKENKSIVLISAGKHLKSDALTSLGLILGLTAIYFTKIVAIDSLIALGFGIYIAIVGFKLVKKAIAGIMDEADFELIDILVSALQKERASDWIDIHNLRVIKYGSQLHIDCHLTLPWYYTVKESHLAVDRVEGVVKSTFGKSAELFIHVDPCVPSCCAICQVKNCPKRESEFKSLPLWNMKNLTENKKHHS